MRSRDARKRGRKSSDLVLFLRKAVLQGQPSHGGDEQDCTQDDHPEVEEDDTEEAVEGTIQGDDDNNLLPATGLAYVGYGAIALVLAGLGAFLLFFRRK